MFPTDHDGIQTARAELEQHGREAAAQIFVRNFARWVAQTWPDAAATLREVANYLAREHT